MKHPWWHWLFTRWVEGKLIFGSDTLQVDTFYCSRCKKFFNETLYVSGNKYREWTNG